MVASTEEDQKLLRSDVKTEMMTYPCPHCGTYNLPYMHTKSGIAYMLCSNCGVQYKTSTKVSANFRKLCSRVGSKPNRSQGYYTPLEKKVKRLLEKCGYREGIDYIHNVRVRNGRKYYWCDFYIPKEDLIIECSPSIWHTRWNREKSDEEKYGFLMSNGLKIVTVDDKNYKEVVKYLKWSVR